MYRFLWVIFLALFLSGCMETNHVVENLPSTSLESQQPDRTVPPTEVATTLAESTTEATEAATTVETTDTPTKEVTTMSEDRKWISEILSWEGFGEWQFYDINLDGSLELIIRDDGLFEDTYIYFVYRLEGNERIELGNLEAMYYKETYEVEGNDGLSLYYDPKESRYFYLSDIWSGRVQEADVDQFYVNGERIERFHTLISYRYDVDEMGRLHITEGKLEDTVVLQDCYCDKSEVLEKIGLGEYLSDKVLVESNVLIDGWNSNSDTVKMGELDSETLEKLHQAYEQAFAD